MYNLCTMNKRKRVALYHRYCSKEFSSEAVKNGYSTKVLHQVAIYVFNEKDCAMPW